MRRSFLFSAILAAALAACGQRDEGASITFNSADGGGALDAKSGAVKIDTPLFKGQFNLPKMSLTADNFDINGVHLYPGSKIGGVNVDAGKEGEDGVVSVKFDSPAAATTVRDWFKAEFEKQGIAVRTDANGLSGRADDKPFRIDLTPQGGRAAGTVTIG